MRFRLILGVCAAVAAAGALAAPVRKPPAAKPAPKKPAALVKPAPASVTASTLATTLKGLGYVSKPEGPFQQIKIEEEKFALKTLRGDFRHLPTVHDLEAKEEISRLEGEGGPALDDDVLPPKVDPKDAVKEVLQATRQH